MSVEGDAEDRFFGKEIVCIRGNDHLGVVERGDSVHANATPDDFLDADPRRRFVIQEICETRVDEAQQPTLPPGEAGRGFDIRRSIPLDPRRPVVPERLATDVLNGHDHRRVVDLHGDSYLGGTQHLDQDGDEVIVPGLEHRVQRGLSGPPISASQLDHPLRSHWIRDRGRENSGIRCLCRRQLRSHRRVCKGGAGRERGRGQDEHRGEVGSRVHIALPASLPGKA